MRLIGSHTQRGSQQRVTIIYPTEKLLLTTATTLSNEISFITIDIVYLYG